MIRLVQFISYYYNISKKPAEHPRNSRTGTAERVRVMFVDFSRRNANERRSPAVARRR